MINLKELDEFAKIQLSQFNVELDEKKALNFLLNELREEIEDLNTSETKKARLEYFSVEGVTSDDYSENFLDLGGGRKIIYGVRHLGGNKDIPFINLRTNFPIKSKSEVLGIYEIIQAQMKRFKPLYLSFCSRDRVDVDFIGSVHMVAKAWDILKVSPWDYEGRIELRTIRDDSYYNWYKNGYEQFHEECPELKAKVTVNSKDSMQESMDEGLLEFVYLEGEKIGLISAERSFFLGHPGLYFHEIFVSKDFKGKGFAKAIQRKFVSKHCDEDDFVWGTIDSSNLPSYKTAYANGRRPVQYECFVKI